jgi:predicted ATPase/DNA-binding SARP family transcriptional activator
LLVAVLGPVEMCSGAALVPVAQRGLRALLAVLALSANRVVHSDSLIDALWQEEPSQERERNLHARVYQLRRVLGGAEPGRVQPRLVTTAPGYKLELADHELDAARFRLLISDGRAAAAAGEHARAADVFAAALRLWRGPALADVAGQSRRLEAEATALDELRLTATEDWAEAALGAGRHTELTDDLAALVGQRPFRERLRGQLMLALYRSGRQAQALDAYQQGRQILAEELGIDPSQELQQLYQRMLQADPGLSPGDRPGAQVRRRPQGGPPARPDGPEPRLPVLTDSFVGREAELAEVCKLIEEHRLVTITGPGGAGKTRLAIHVARELSTGRGQRGVAFVDASPLTEAALITDRLIRALGIRPAPGLSITDALSHEIAGQHLLVVLDNLEHLAGAAPVLTELLRLDDGLRILATSRISLRARGEHVYPLAPLATTGRGTSATQSPAVALFADRASAADPSFEITTTTAGVVAEICKRLDGLPLAIELAASRVRILPPQALAARLDRRLDLLAGPAGDRPDRHHALRATIDWSYQLLTPAGRQLFRALGVLTGSFGISAALAVCGYADELRLLTELEGLLDASLIETAPRAASERRFRMLETIRQFALEQLRATGEERLPRDRHAEYICTFAAAAAPKLTGPDQVASLDQLDAEEDSIDAALGWLLASGRVADASRTASALWRFWHLRAHLDKGRAMLEAIVAAEASALPADLRADVLSALGSVAYWQRDYPRAQDCYQQALLISLGHDLAATMALAHYNLGFTAVYAGDYDSAAAHFGEALAAYHSQADEQGMASAISGQALVDRMTGNFERARDRAADGLSRQRLAGDQLGATNTLGLLGSINARMGHLADAENMLRDALIAHDRAGNVSGIVWMLHELAATAAMRGEISRAIVLSSAAHSADGELGGGISPNALGLLAPVEAARGLLGPSEAQEAWNTGQHLTLRQALEAGLST